MITLDFQTHMWKFISLSGNDDRQTNWYITAKLREKIVHNDLANLRLTYT
jgi:hypothetical protein